MKVLLLNDREFKAVKEAALTSPWSVWRGILNKIADVEEEERTGVRALWADQINTRPCTYSKCPNRP